MRTPRCRPSTHQGTALPVAVRTRAVRPPVMSAAISRTAGRSRPGSDTSIKVPMISSPYAER